MPLQTQRSLVVINVHRQPNIPTFPKRIGVPLIPHVQPRRPLRPRDPQTKPTLRIKRPGAQRRDKKWLRPRALQPVGSKANDIVGSVARLVGHEGVVGRIGLDDRRGLEVVFGEAVDDGFEGAVVGVVAGEVDVAGVTAVAVGVEGVGVVVFVVCKGAKVLGPVAKWGGCVDEAWVVLLEGEREHWNIGYLTNRGR